MSKNENRGSRLPSEEPWDNDPQMWFAAAAIGAVLAGIVYLVGQLIRGR